MSYSKTRKGGWTLTETTQSFVGIPAVPSTPLVSKAQSNWTDSFGGDYNPAYKALIRDQAPATTPASGLKVLTHSLPYAFATATATNRTFPFYQRFELTGEPLSAIGNALGSFSFPRITVDTNTLNHVTARANSQFVEKAKSAISSFESGQDLAELRQTIESVIHPMKSLRELTLSYFAKLKKAKRRYKIVSDIKKAASDAYLEWTFGWKPLTFDIADGIVGLQNRRLPSTPIQSHASDTYQFSELKGSAGSSTQCFMRANVLVTAHYSRRLKGVVSAYYHKEPPGLQQELQLLPEDFLPTAWDLLPYSFVTDYFLNIGDIIRAYSFPSAALKWCNGSTMDLTRTRIAFSIDNKARDVQYPPSLGYDCVCELSCPNLDVETRQFTRSNVSASDLVPVLVFSIPVSAKPWENMAALLFGGSIRLTPLY